jgi:hypothetical protein
VAEAKVLQDTENSKRKTERARKRAERGW